MPVFLLQMKDQFGVIQIVLPTRHANMIGWMLEGFQVKVTRKYGTLLWTMVSTVSIITWWVEMVAHERDLSVIPVVKRMMRYIPQCSQCRAGWMLQNSEKHDKTVVLFWCIFLFHPSCCQPLHFLCLNLLCHCEEGLKLIAIPRTGVRHQLVYRAQSAIERVDVRTCIHLSTCIPPSKDILIISNISLALPLWSITTLSCNINGGTVRIATLEHIYNIKIS